MAGFHTKTFTQHDDYMTPKHAWEDIQHLIPKDKVIYEPFYGDGKSGDYLTELGYTVWHQDVDFYDNEIEPEWYDIIVSNPPFSDVKRIMKKLAELDKPFIMLMPSSKINTSYLYTHGYTIAYSVCYNCNFETDVTILIRIVTLVNEIVPCN